MNSVKNQSSRCNLVHSTISRQRYKVQYDYLMIEINILNIWKGM